jgi:tripartite-type tricarboxylate transporter receptor subunit TctC
VVDNRVGAGGRIAAEALKNAPPNGTTVMLAPIVVPVLAPLVYKKLNYEVQKDLAPVAHIADFQFGVSVKADSPIRNIADLVAAVKKTPSLGAFGSPAPGSLPHFFGVMIGQKTGLDMTHVPYNGGAQLMTALMGNQVPVGIDTLVDQGEMHRAGKSRILATSGASRNSLFPDVPTLQESGFKDLVGVGWFALFAPGGTDSNQINILNAAVNRALKNPALKDRFTKMGLEIGGGSPQDLQALINAETARWTPVVKASGFTAD